MRRLASMFVHATFLVFFVGNLTAQDGVEMAVQSGSDIRALTVVRLFCLPCRDRYAHQMPARSVAWGVEGRNGAVKRVEEGWTRRGSGSIRLASPPAVNDGERVLLLINGERFNPEHVYLFFDDRWQNVAFHFGLPDGGAFESLPSYIRVERAPFREEPSVDDQLFGFYDPL